MDGWMERDGRHLPLDTRHKNKTSMLVYSVSVCRVFLRVIYLLTIHNIGADIQSFYKLLHWSINH